MCPWHTRLSFRSRVLGIQPEVRCHQSPTQHSFQADSCCSSSVNCADRLAVSDCSQCERVSFRAIFQHVADTIKGKRIDMPHKLAWPGVLRVLSSAVWMASHGWLGISC